MVHRVAGVEQNIVGRAGQGDARPVAGVVPVQPAGGVGEGLGSGGVDQSCRFVCRQVVTHRESAWLIHRREGTRRRSARRQERHEIEVRRQITIDGARTQGSAKGGVSRYRQYVVLPRSRTADFGLDGAVVDQVAGNIERSGGCRCPRTDGATVGEYASARKVTDEEASAALDDAAGAIGECGVIRTDAAACIDLDDTAIGEVVELHAASGGT